MESRRAGAQTQVCRRNRKVGLSPASAGADLNGRVRDADSYFCDAFLVRLVRLLCSQMRAHNRDRDISDLRQVGVPRSEVARRFGLSTNQVRRIEHYYETPPPQAHALNVLHQAIRTADDPQKPWPALDLVHALALPSSTRRVLLAYFDRTGTHELTLLRFMELVLCDDGESVVNFRKSKLLAVPGIDIKSYWSVAKALTALDLGNKGNSLWRKRIASLRGKWRITLPPPCRPPGPLPT